MANTPPPREEEYVGIMNQFLGCQPREHMRTGVVPNPDGAAAAGFSHVPAPAAVPAPIPPSWGFVSPTPAPVAADLPAGGPVPMGEGAPYSGSALPPPTREPVESAAAAPVRSQGAMAMGDARPPPGTSAGTSAGSLPAGASGSDGAMAGAFGAPMVGRPGAPNISSGAMTPCDDLYPDADVADAGHPSMSSLPARAPAPAPVVRSEGMAMPMGGTGMAMGPTPGMPMAGGR